MAKSDLTAVNAKTISVNGTPITGSVTAYGPYTTFDQLDADMVLALNGTVVFGTAGARQAFTAIDHLNVLSGISLAEMVQVGTASTPASNNATGPIGVGGGVVPSPTPTPVPTPSPTPTPAPVHQLLTPAATNGVPESSSSVSYDITLQQDEVLPVTGYKDFRLFTERATNAAFTQGYTSETITITEGAPGATIDSGDLDSTIRKGLDPATNYRFRDSVLPPAGSTSYSASDPSTPISVTTRAAVGFDPANKSGSITLSENNKLMTASDTNAFQTAILNTEKSGDTYLEFDLPNAPPGGNPYLAFGACAANEAAKSPDGLPSTGDASGYPAANAPFTMGLLIRSGMYFKLYGPSGGLEDTKTISLTSYKAFAAASRVTPIRVNTAGPFKLFQTPPEGAVAYELA